jgi:hypothetical protein
MRRAAVGALAVALVLGGGPARARAQVFISSEPHPEFTIAPLFIVATVRPDLGPVSVRVSWSVALPPNRPVRESSLALYLLWPGEVAEATAPGPPDPTLKRHVEERGFSIVSGGQLALEARDRTQLGTLADGTRLPETAAFVTFYKTGTNPVQSGVGTFVRIPWTPHLTDAVSLLSLTMALKDMITPKPATWVEELFWGRRQVLTLTAGSAGSLALYSLYFDQRDRVVRLGRDFSVLVATFMDNDHLRLEEISPGSATRRPSRLRAGAEVVSLPIAASEGAVPQTLRVQFSYYSGPIAWRPILVSLALIILGNVMGAIMFGREINRFFRSRFHVQPPARPLPRPNGVPPASAISSLVPGTTTHNDVLALCGPPIEERERRQSPTVRTLVYRGVQRVPHPRFRLGWLATISHWDEEQHEIEIVLQNDRVTDVQTRIRRSRLR